MDEGSADCSAPRFLVSASGALLGWLISAALLAIAADEVRFLVAFGLLAPTGLAVVVLAAVWVTLVHQGRHLPRVRSLLQRPDYRLRILLGSIAAVLAWWGAGHLALRLMVAFHERPIQGGLLLAVTALGCLVMGGQAVYRGTELLSRRVRPPGAVASVVIAVGLFVGLVASSVWMGSTSGTGSATALFGVFLRDELDLSPVGSLALMATAAYALGYLAMRVASRAMCVLSSSVALSVAIWGMLAAAGLPFSEALQVERGGGLPAHTLAFLQKQSDFDGDGVAGLFGGGDCDDQDPRVAPGRVDIPDNGVDEDCSGGDRQGSIDTAPAPSPQVAEANSPDRPDDLNVLLLTVDTLRWDLGYASPSSREGLSPVLDALAERSTVFERAYALASYTSKSLGPMLIGRYPSETLRSFEHFDRFHPSVPFLQERAQRAGIATVSVQGYWYFYFKTYGFERGWDTLDASAAPKVVAIEGDRTKNGDKVATATIQRLEELAQSGKRFLAWAHWVDPHAEYVRHEAFDYGPESRARYDGEVSFSDQQVGRVLAALTELGLSERTMVLVTSDHGEAFGEHGMIRHGFEVWEELVRVPLIVHVPGATPRRVAERRSLIDVAPTIMEALELPPPQGDDFIRGASLMSDVFAPPGQPLAERPVLVDMPEGPHNKQRRAFYYQNWKLITSSGRVVGVYDLATDPGEKQDLSKDKQLLSRLQTKMNEFLDGLREVPAAK